ncbi:MAG: hypothetical protein REI95_00625 [Oxalicibacterium faecigallinarum]|nr:hypothetical protein [Oxalicibacterium faecigallinarum]MDQ7968122.1 hypothetical protein [Oxalicibacterium faecigallinarum]
MSKPESIEPVETLAQQKERLILQCRAYRAGLGQSRNVVRSNLGREALAKTALSLVGARAHSALSNVSDLINLSGGLSLAKIQRMAPYVLSGITFLSRRSVLKPVLRGAALVAALGAGLYFFSKKKKN